jgi:hypothetical protein
MGLVTFGQTKLQIDAIPDGHVVISENDFQRLNGVNNALLLLKSKIPAGIDESQLPTLLEKGQKFDALNQELTNVVKTRTDLETSLSKFKDMPKDFSADKWNAFVNKEKTETRKAKLDSIMQEAYKGIGEKLNVKDLSKLKVDDRFLPKEIAELDLNDPNATQKVADYLGVGYKEQQNFIQQATGVVPPKQPAPGGASGQVPPQTGDKVGPDGVTVGQFK